MPERPYTLLSCGMSIDGYIDTATDERLVGATTLRNANPDQRGPARPRRQAADD